MTNQHDSQTASAALARWIAARIGASGPVTFAQFMDWALYHPDWGYYSRGPNIGARGDFTTSPEASPAFGRLLARHAVDIDALLGHPGAFTLIECGPGRGTLAADLLDTLRAEHPSLYDRLQYLLVEVSPSLRASQQKRLQAHSGKTRWFESLAQIDRPVEGGVIANEVVDAFPVHVLENRGGDLLEWFVDVAQGSDFRPVLRPPSGPELPSFVAEQGIELRPGERIEVNLAAGEWIEQVSHAIARGIVTIIDYGDVAPQRYSAARREGTLLGYFGGAVTDNVLARPGAQDLTALVDFTALLCDAQRAGFDDVGMTRQANFLLGLGLGTAVTATSGGEGLGEALTFRRGLQTLINPEGLGRFHVLVLARGVDPTAALAALSGLQYAGI